MFKSKSIQAFLIFFLLIEVPIAYTQARDYWPTVNWRSSLPEMQGVDSEELGVMTKYVKEKLPQTSSILIVRNGYLIYEQYFAGKSDDLCSVWSISKSVISTLLGMAKDSGSISGLDQRLIDFFPQFKSDSAQAAVNRVTLRHMLTMSSGLSNENGVPDPELIKRIVDYSMNKEPGSKFVYNENDPAMVSMIIGKAVNQNTLSFAAQRLFGPLGIYQFSWAARKDYPCGSTDLSLRSRDMAKIGYLYLNNGIWEGKQLLSTDWIQESTRKEIEIDEKVVPKPFTFGYFWWNYPVAGYYSYHAYGNGGQIIMVIPDLDLVYVSTSKNRNDDDSPLTYLPEKYIVNAIK